MNDLFLPTGSQRKEKPKEQVTAISTGFLESQNRRLVKFGDLRAALHPHKHTFLASFIGAAMILTVAIATPVFDTTADGRAAATTKAFEEPAELAFLPTTTSLPTLFPSPPLVSSQTPKPETKITKIVGGWLMSGSEDDFAYAGDVFPFKHLSPFWWQVGEDGTSVKDKFDYLPVKQLLYKAKSRGIAVIPTISSDPNIASIILADQEKRKQLVQSITKKTIETKVQGIDIDFEQLHADDAPNFTAFVKELKTALKENGKLLTVDLEARIGNDVSHDWKSIGEAADFVHIMGYDYHARNSGTPGAIGPIGWLKDVINFAKANIPPEKIILGLGVYGYDWAQGEDGSLNGEGLTYADVKALIEEKSISITRSSGVDDRGYEIGSVPFFGYNDEEGKPHFVWFEDKESILEKTALLEDIGGLYFWRLNAEDDALWPDLKTRLENTR